MPNLENMTLVELRTLAKENNIKNISKLKKDELIEILNQIIKTENTENNDTEIQETSISERHYDANGEPIVDYKLTNEGDEIAEGILEVLPDGYGFLRGDNFLHQ